MNLILCLYFCVVSIGYSIGYGVLKDPTDGSKIFSVFFNFFGVIIISGYVTLMIRMCVDGKADWRLNALRAIQEREMVTAYLSIKSLAMTPITKISRYTLNDRCLKTSM